MCILFEITTSTGEIHQGHVMGSGGYLGAGTAYQDRTQERSAATRQLERMIAFANRTGELPPGLASEPGGLCVLHPSRTQHFARFEDFSAAIKALPLMGASFRTLN